MSWALLVLALLPNLAAASDEPDELMGCRILVVRSRLVKFVCVRGAQDFDLPDAANDPTASGGTLRIEDTGSAQNQTFMLAPAGWLPLGSPPGATGYLYRGGPVPDCRRVVVKQRFVKAVCRGEGIMLTPPFVGDASVVLTVGPASKRYCARFGGVPLPAPPDALRRKDAPAPAACFEVTTTTTTSSTSTSTSSVTTPGFCGDGVCFGFFGEFCGNCPQDCGPCGTCDLDAVCDREGGGEHCLFCFQDCGSCSCDADTVCEPLQGEHCAVCNDCAPCNGCPDGICSGGETCGTCPTDCCP
jgi:hypothetical protein